MSQQKSAKILVVGSLAYDHIMEFDGDFKDVLVPNNYSFALAASSRSISYGGCAGNIAYTLKLLGEEPIIMTVAGRDFEAYKKRLQKLGIVTDYIYESKQELTSSAFIVTDQKEHQIQIFDPGAAKIVQSEQKISDVGELAWAIIAPDNPKRMAQMAGQAKELGIPYVFDPGQAMANFEDEDLDKAAKSAEILILNRYEAGLYKQRLGKLAQVPIYVETDGAEGCVVKSSEGDLKIDAVVPTKLVDPTGCGDAFRAGLLTGLRKKYSIKKACQMGVLVATYSIESKGTQEHHFTVEEFANRFQKEFENDII